MKGLVLGLDPGLAAYGWGVIYADGPKLAYVAEGTIKTKKDQEIGVGADMLSRVSTISLELKRIIEKYKPLAVAVEEFKFYGKSRLTSILQLGRVIGMTHELLRNADIHTVEYSSQMIKMRVVGAYKNVDKKAVKKMVKLHLRMKELPKTEHGSDALAAAIVLASELKFNTRGMT